MHTNVGNDIVNRLDLGAACPADKLPGVYIYYSIYKPPNRGSVMYGPS